MMNGSSIIVNSISKNTCFSFPKIETLKAQEELVCALSGAIIRTGEAFTKVKPNAGSFTDWQYLSSDPESGYLTVSEDAAKLFTGEFLKYQASISGACYSQDEAIMLTTDAARMDFLMNPPKPPFVAYIATTLGQHVAWKAPVTLDQDLIRIGYAKMTLTIRRPVFLEALQLCQDIVQSFNDYSKELLINAPKSEQKKRKDIVSPFVVLLRDMDTDNHAMLRSDVVDYLNSINEQRSIAFLESLTEGEYWALSVFLKVKKEVPQRVSIKEKLLSKAAAKELESASA